MPNSTSALEFAPPSRWWLAWRLLGIAWVFALALFRLGWRLLEARRVASDDRLRMAGEVVATTLERLGATFVKFGQILSTRPDLLSPSFIAPLSRLQDQVPPAPFADVERLLEREWAPDIRARVAWIDPRPLAAASVAQVHIGRLEGGDKLAIKVQRPRAREQIERDLALMNLVARAVNLVPSLKMLSLPGAVARFSSAMHRQLDFRLEAANNQRFAANFADTPALGVPRLYDELCTERVLVMELIDGVRATEPEKVGGDRLRLATIGMDAILRMVFAHGFVHADLHPGNILLTPDNRVILIDLGLVATIEPALMRPYVETFLALARQDGATAARLFYTYAPEVHTRDYAAYEYEIISYFRSLAGKTLGQVETSEVLGGIMNILRRHRVQMDPAFTVVHIALIVAEGLGKQLNPGLDPIQLAIPYLMRTLATAPPGKAPHREVPTAALGSVLK